MTFSDYQYEVFISYSRSDLITPWVIKYFHPFLKNQLIQYLGGHQVRVFVDQKDIQSGDRWPQLLRDALLTSRCLVPVFSGDYFSRAWCYSEWFSFVEREKRLRLEDTSGSLIVPIQYNDGEWFPEEAKQYQRLDFKGCRSTSPNFENHANFPLFEQQVEELAKTVAPKIQYAPQFDPDWPVMEVNPMPRQPPPLKTLV